MVFVVEDEVIVAMVLEEQLRDLGFDVVHVRSDAEARQVLQVNEIALAICDLHLAGLTTVALIADLRTMGTPVLVCSGTMDFDKIALPEDVARLPKPYLLPDLEAAIAAL